MMTSDFNKLAETEINKIKSILVDKTAEYNHEADRLEFFKKAASFQDVTTAEALLGMASKHFISIAQMVRSKEEFTLEQWENKCIDCINYCLLLLAVESEEIENKYTEVSIVQNVNSR